MAETKTILIADNSYSYGASVIAGGAALYDQDAVVVGRIMRWHRRGTDPVYGWEADVIRSEGKALPDRIDDPHPQSSMGSLYSIQIGPIQKSAYSLAVEGRGGRAPKPERPAPLPIPEDLKWIKGRLQNLMTAYFQASGYGNEPPLTPPLVEYRQEAEDRVEAETVAHPTRRARGAYAIRYVATVDLERCRQAWSMTGGIEALDEIIVTEAQEGGWIDGGEVWKVSGLRQGVMDHRRRRFVIRALDGTPIASPTITGLKTLVRRYNKHVRLGNWGTLPIIASCYPASGFEETTLNIAVTNARFAIPSGQLTLVGRRQCTSQKYGSRGQVALRQADDGQWVQSAPQFPLVRGYQDWRDRRAAAAAKKAEKEMEPKPIPEEDLDAIEAMGL